LSEFVADNAVVYFPGDHGLESRPFAELFPFAFYLDGE
jgi:hypothetical protein